MTRLTVTEKEHWKARIDQRIDKAIERLHASDPSLMQNIHAQAEVDAHKFLGTYTNWKARTALQTKIRQLEEERESLERKLCAQVLGDQKSKQNAHYLNRSEYADVVRKTISRFEEVLLQSSETGREILRLKSERDALLDTVWLATSSIQIRDLWGRVVQVLGEEPTTLQQQILASTQP